MAIARWAMKNQLQQLRVCTWSTGSSLSSLGLTNLNLQRERWYDGQGPSQIVKRFISGGGGGGGADEYDENKLSQHGQGVSVKDGDKKKKQSKLFSLFPWRRGSNSHRWIRSRSDDQHLLPSLHAIGNALMHASENVNKLLEHISPRRLFGRLRQKDESYQLRFEVPGIGKEDLKITVGKHGLLTIYGEVNKEGTDEEDEDDDEFWSYGYYFTGVRLPEDAKIDEIKAKLEHGVLVVTVPRMEKPESEVKEVVIQ